MKRSEVVLQNVLVYVALNTVFFTIWFFAVSFLLPKRDVSPYLLLNSQLLGLTYLFLRYMIGIRKILAAIIVLIVLPFLLLISPASIVREVNSIFLTFPVAWMFSILTFLWLPSLLSILLAFCWKRGSETGSSFRA